MIPSRFIPPITPEAVMAVPSADNPRPSQLALGLAVAVFLFAAVVVPLIPADVRPWNVTAFGALALFVAARGGRFGLVSALGLALGTKLASDLLNHVQHGYDPDYLPFTAPIFGLAVYGGLAFYAILGWLTLRQTGSPLRIGGAAAVGSVAFYLVTNYASWVRQDLPYPPTLAGLLESYWMGVPFFRGTLVGDLSFTGVLFGLHALLGRVAESSATPAEVPVETPTRS